MAKVRTSEWSEPPGQDRASRHGTISSGESRPCRSIGATGLRSGHPLPSLKIQWLPIPIQFITVNLSKCYKRFILAVAQIRSLFGLADGASDFLLLTSRM